MVFLIILAFVSAVSAAGGDTGESVSRPDIYGLINILYLKADANLNGIITQEELSDVFKGFDKNGDGVVTNGEFVELWILLTSQTNALANAYFHLADLDDNNVINNHDYPLIYRVFDLNHDHLVSSQEFATKWEDIIRETPFAVLFERSDTNKDEFLSQAEYRKFFSSFDTDSNGYATNREFDEGWSHADFALLSDADSLFNDLDSNHDGRITGEDLDPFFTKYDIDGDNQLSLQETIQMKNMLVLPRTTIRPTG